MFFEVKPVSMDCRNRLQHTNRFCGNFWSNTIPWQNCDS